MHENDIGSNCGQICLKWIDNMSAPSKVHETQYGIFGHCVIIHAK
jgi:hypothetical protein